MTKTFITDDLLKESLAKRLPLCADRYQRYTRYSQRMKRIRRIMPLTAALALALIFVWPELMVYLERDPTSSFQLDQKIHIRNRLNNPYFQSTDNNGRPFKVHAQSAFQSRHDKVNLEEPQSHIQLEDGTGLEITAINGIYDDQTKKLDYEENVILKSTTGYQLKTSLAHLDVQTKQASGNQPVNGDGPTGRIVAEGFQADSKGKIDFKGKSHLTIPAKLPQTSEK